MEFDGVSFALALVGVASDIDDLALDIPDAVSWGTRALIAVFLFGVALDVRVEDFKEVGRRPWVFGVGLAVQFVLMPVVTLGLISVLDVQPSVALGMMLVVCLPAGNLSNILTYRARGDLALSVSMTTVSNAAAVLVTPLALAFWGSQSARVEQVLDEVELSPLEVLLDVGLLIAVPFVAGIFVAHVWPAFAARARRYVEPAVIALISLLVIGGFAANVSTAIDFIQIVAVAVIAQNAASLAVGYLAALGCRLPPAGRHAMTLEMGVRNTSLGLALALTFFEGLGGVAVIMALYGLWDVVTGFALASWWRRGRRGAEADATPATDRVE